MKSLRLNKQEIAIVREVERKLIDAGHEFHTLDADSGESAARATHRFGDALGLSPAARTKQGFEHQKPENENDENEFAEFES